MSQSFVHLHLHTQYSLLDGTTRLEPLIEQAVRFGMPAVAVTDHGNLFGAISFYRAAKKAGIKPIIGCEMYLAPKSRFAKESQGVHEDDYSVGGAATPYYHQILLAADETGYRNLIRLVSLANTEGFYYKPRIDKESLNRYHAGLIGLSGCLRGEIPYLLSRGREEEAYAAARDYQEIFGRDNFFIEIQDNGLELQQTTNRQLIALAQKTGIPLVATNDCHYLHADDAHAHDVMLCLQTGKTLNMPNRMRFDTKQLYFKSPDEMIRGIGEIPEAISNTVKIAERIDLNLKFGEVHLPEYTAPVGTTREAYLAQLAQAGLSHRLARGGQTIPQADYEARLARELSVINAMGYAGYFLIVWDIIRYAREHQIPVGPGRGSAAGSLVAYALAITDIDPIPHGLIFERFLNPERVTLPDIDMDFCMDRREEVIRYVTQKYGADHVAQIITFGTMAAKAALRDVGRVMEMPYADADRLAKLVPNVLGITLEDAVEKEPKLAQAAADDPQVREVISLARQLEGLTRHASTHAAGVVISSGPLTDHVPLYRGSRGEIVTQYAMEDLEKVGLIKFDFLGLRTLTVIDHAVRFIQTKQPDGPNIATLPLDDAATYALLGSGQTVGIFQLESRGMRDLLLSMQPEKFEEIVALLALYRPGPIGSGMITDFIKRKRGETKITYELPQLEPILASTYGVIVYQEQVMQVAHVLANFSLGEADLLRRAMGKKKPEEMAAQKALFVERAGKNQITRAKAEKIFDLLEYFAGYGFNKSHSAAYALITYQTAWLKCHHPVEFMAALLSSEMGNSDKIVPYLSECRRMGIRILPPDVNESGKGFAVVAEGIRFGLAAIKNVGEAAIDIVLAERQRAGRFASLFNFCRRVDSRKCNRRVIESLIQCGAFDSTGAQRAALAESLDTTMQAGAAAQKRAESGQLSMFGGETGEDDAPPLPNIPEWDDLQRSKLEKELTGFYITTHPLARHEAVLKKSAVTPIAQLGAPDDGEPGEETQVTMGGDDAEVRICGMMISQKVATTRRGDKMAYLRVEDMTGAIEVIVFPDLYATAAPLLQQDNPLLIFGTIESGERGTKMKATGMRLFPSAPPQRPEPSDDERRPVTTGATGATGATGNIKSKASVGQNEETQPLTLRVSAETIGPADLQELKALLQSYPGHAPVRLVVCSATSEVTLATDPRLRVEPSNRLREAISRRFGTGIVPTLPKAI